jgi:hypothetical protein
VRVANAKVDFRSNALFVGEARGCANEMWTPVDARDPTREAGSASDRARRYAGTAAEIKN